MDHEGDGLTYYIGLMTSAPFLKVADQTVFNAAETRIFDTEIMVVKWSSDGADTSIGLSGYIERIG